MSPKSLRQRPIDKELRFHTSRSGGPGGQHANKTETQVELRFSIHDSHLLSEEEKERLMKKLSNRITKEGELILTVESSRSQVRNREEATEKFYALLEQALKKPKKRKPTKPPKAAKRKRLEEKKKHSEKKDKRKPPKI
ncbi:MAG TPA: alternative ribosome rescue aminoacyl-tRNA hydrolase ArfB [Bacteroidales bacterium]|nr:alternative ribosome rescue aminoacyl-tRNA hydrolase ArfB [Bacteroidales bacterium]